MSKPPIDPSLYTDTPVDFIMEIDGIHVFQHTTARDNARWFLIDTRRNLPARTTHSGWVISSRLTDPGRPSFGAHHLDLSPELRRRIAATLSLLES